MINFILKFIMIWVGMKITWKWKHFQNFLAVVSLVYVLILVIGFFVEIYRGTIRESFLSGFASFIYCWLVMSFSYINSNKLKRQFSKNTFSKMYEANCNRRKFEKS